MEEQIANLQDAIEVAIHAAEKSALHSPETEQVEAKLYEARLWAERAAQQFGAAPTEDDVLPLDEDTETPDSE